MAETASTVARGEVTIRDATLDDVDFVAWVMQTAARSHLEHSIWEYMNRQTEGEVIAYMAKLAVTETVHLFHHSLFLVAEVGGRPAAGLCGYDPETEGFGAYMTAAGPVAQERGIAWDDEFAQRAAAIMGGFAETPAEHPWVVENVAKRPEFRRRGLIDALLVAVLERGRSKGFHTAQIGVLIGNEAARRAYLKAGFSVVAEKRDALFEAAMGCPGSELLLRDL